MQCCVSCLSKRKLDGSLQIQEFSYQQFSFQKFSHLEFSLQKFSNLEFSLQQLSNLQLICASNFQTCNKIVLPIFTPATKKFLQFTIVKFFQLSILQLISHPIFAHLIFPHPHKIPPIFMIPYRAENFSPFRSLKACSGDPTHKKKENIGQNPIF